MSAPLSVLRLEFLLSASGILTMFTATFCVHNQHIRAYDRKHEADRPAPSTLQHCFSWLVAHITFSSLNVVHCKIHHQWRHCWHQDEPMGEQLCPRPRPLSVCHSGPTNRWVSGRRGRTEGFCSLTHLSGLHTKCLRNKPTSSWSPS